jgi:hypothetical protein
MSDDLTRLPGPPPIPPPRAPAAHPPVQPTAATQAPSLGRPGAVCLVWGTPSRPALSSLREALWGVPGALAGVGERAGTASVAVHPVRVAVPGEAGYGEVARGYLG